MNINDFILKVMAVPFKDKGRDYEGLDCWGLCRLGFHEVYGVELPSYLDDYTDAGKTQESRLELSELIALKKRKWEQVTQYHPMDVALFTLGGMPVHVGLMIDKKNFLHCEKKIGTVIESLNSLMWERRLSGVYRLCQA